MYQARINADTIKYWANRYEYKCNVLLSRYTRITKGETVSPGETDSSRETVSPRDTVSPSLYYDTTLYANVQTETMHSTMQIKTTGEL